MLDLAHGPTAGLAVHIDTAVGAFMDQPERYFGSTFSLVPACSEPSNVTWNIATA